MVFPCVSHGFPMVFPADALCEAKHEIDEKTQSLLTDAYSHAAEYLRSQGKWRLPQLDILWKIHLSMDDG